MGDRLGTPGAVGFYYNRSLGWNFFFRFFTNKNHATHVYNKAEYAPISDLTLPNAIQTLISLKVIETIFEVSQKMASSSFATIR